MKELITATTISDARKPGKQHIYVAPDALITPQARDDAKSYGIALLTKNASATMNNHQYTDNQYIAPQYATAQYNVHQYNDHYNYMQSRPLAQGSFPSYALTSQHRVLMNNNNTSNGMDPAMQQLVEQVLQAIAPAPIPANSGCQTLAQNPMTYAQAPVNSNACAAIPNSDMQSGQNIHGQGINATAIADQVVQQVNTLLASRGGIAAFPTLESTIAELVAQYTTCGQSPQPSQHIMTAPPVGTNTTYCPQANLNGVDVVPFSQAQPMGRVQGEVNIEEALLPGQNGPGVTRFTFADTSLVWTFTHQEVLVVTHGNVELQGAGGSCMLTQGSAIRVSSGTSVTLIAHGHASCVCSTWPK